MLARSRILNRPPTLTQTHPLQSSLPKRTTPQRKKHISNLKLYNANSTNPNAARTTAPANQSSRSFVNNRGPTWTFAMISSHNSNSNSLNSSRSSRRSSQPNGSSNRGGASSNRSFGPKKDNRIVASPIAGNQKNNTVGGSSLQASSSPPMQSSKPLRSSSSSSSSSSSKLLSSTRRPFLSRSINYRPPPVDGAALASNQSTPARSLESDLSPNRSIEASSRPKPSTNAKPGSNTGLTLSAKPKTTTIVAISSGQHPFNFNPVQFMQTFFDQFFSPTKSNGGGGAGNFFSFFNWPKPSRPGSFPLLGL